MEGELKITSFVGNKFKLSSDKGTVQRTAKDFLLFDEFLRKESSEVLIPLFQAEHEIVFAQKLVEFNPRWRESSTLAGFFSDEKFNLPVDTSLINSIMTKLSDWKALISKPLLTTFYDSKSEERLNFACQKFEQLHQAVTFVEGSCESELSLLLEFERRVEEFTIASTQAPSPPVQTNNLITALKGLLETTKKAKLPLEEIRHLFQRKAVLYERHSSMKEEIRKEEVSFHQGNETTVRNKRELLRDFEKVLLAYNANLLSFLENSHDFIQPILAFEESLSKFPPQLKAFHSR